MHHHFHHPHKHFEIINVYLDGQNVLSIKTKKMANITIDVESNQADLTALVDSANAKIAELQDVLTQITSFQLAFTVAEVPGTTTDAATAPDAPTE